MDPVGSKEGPKLVSDRMGVGSCVLDMFCVAQNANIYPIYPIYPKYILLILWQQKHCASLNINIQSVLRWAVITFPFFINVITK